MRRKKQKNKTRKLWVIPMPLVVILAVIVFGGVGIVGALNGWFGGGGSIPSDTFTRGLVGYWSFDEGSGSIAYDASGNSNDGTLNWMTTNTDAWTDGKVGSALRFDGSDDYVSVSALTSLTAFSFESWFKTSNTSDLQTIHFLDGTYVDPYPQNWLRINPASNKITGYYIDDDNNSSGVDTTQHFADGNWHHIIHLWEDNRHEIWVDGLLEGSDNATTVSSMDADWLHCFGAMPVGGHDGSNKDYFDGVIDEVRIYNRALSEVEVRYHYNRGGPVAHWKFDEGSGSTAYDSTDNDNDGTLYGEMATSTSPDSGWTTGKHGSALIFDNTDDYISAGTNSVFDFGASTDFTIDFWMKADSYDSADIVLAKRDNGPNYVGWNIEIGSTGKVGFKLDSGTPQVFFFSNSEPFDGKWHHISCVADRDGDASIYVDGLFENSSDITSIGDIDSTEPFTMTWYIGSGGAGAGYNGALDDIRVYNYARTAEEIRLDYNAGFAARFGPLSSCDDDPGSCMTEGLVGYWDFEEGNGTIINNSFDGGNDGVLTTGATTTGWTTGIVPLSGGKEGGSAYEFDGTDDYVKVLDDDNLDFGTGDFTVLYWFNSEASFPSGAWIAGKYNGAQGWASNIYMDGNAYLSVFDSGGGATEKYTYVNFTFNTWNFVAFKRENGVLKGSINGGTWSNEKSGAGYDLSNTQDVYIGRNGLTATAYVNGIVDEVRIYNRALSAEEVRYHYNRGGPVAHWSFDSGSGSVAYDATESNNDGTLYGEMATSTSPNSGWTTGKYGSALAFDGSDDYINTGSKSNLDDLSSLTYSVWVKPETLSYGNRILSKGAQTPYNDILIGSSNNNLEFTRSFSTTRLDYITTDTLTLNKWSHIAVTMENKTAHIYINGIEASYSTAINGAGTLTSEASSDLFIGARVIGDTAAQFNGLIDDVRIYNYARTPEEIRLDYNAGFAAHFGPKTDCDSDPGACMTEGLVGYWDMEEGSGTVAYDKSGNSNNGTIVSAPPWSGGIIPLSGGKSGGGALNLDGSADYVDCGNDASLNITTSFTAEAWVKRGAIDATQYIVDRYDWAVTKRVWYLMFYSSNEIRFQVSRDGTKLARAETQSTFTSTNDWYHVVGVYDSSVPELKLYVDGVQMATDITYAGGETSIPSSLYDTDAELFIGADTSLAAGEWFNGLIDEVRIYNRALSAEEVRYHYNRGGPVGHWKMDEGAGTTAYDSTPNDNNGALQYMSTSTNGGWFEGKYGSALYFDGMDDYVVLSNSFNLRGGALSFWARKYDGSANYGLFANAAGGGTNSYITYQNVNFYIEDDSDNYLGMNHGLSSSEQENWHHFVFVYETNNTFKLYIDGTEIGTASGTGSFTLQYIGPGYYVYPKFYGLIDDVRIYNYARTAEQIRLDYNAGLSTYFK